MKDIYGSFPRQTGKTGGRYRTWVSSPAELATYINDNNGRRDCYLSVYAFGSIDAEGTADPASAGIDKIYCDFDNRHGYECFCVLRDWLLGKRIAFRVHPSGKDTSDWKEKPVRPAGFHFYIDVEPRAIASPGQLRAVHEELNDIIRAGLKRDFGIVVDQTIDPHAEDDHVIHEVMDPHVMGDVMRISRIINTYNIKRERFCVGLTADDLFLAPAGILGLMERQRDPGLEFVIDGRPMAIAPGFYEAFEARKQARLAKRVKAINRNGSEPIQASTNPPCIDSILERANEGINLRHEERVLLAAYMTKSGKSENEIVEMFAFQPDFSEKITSYQVHNIAMKGYMPASCSRQAANGTCPCASGSYHPVCCSRSVAIKNPLAFLYLLNADE